MEDALGSGWLIALIVAIPTFLTASATVLTRFGKWIASRWRGPLEALQEANAKLEAELKLKTDKLIEESQLRMEYEIRLDYCMSEVRNWRAGQGGTNL